jgi:hypothetical protein
LESQDIIKKIESFRELEQDWNGYGANPFSEKLITKALDLAKQLSPVPKVFPTGRDSIQLEWETDNMFLEIEVFEDKIEIFNHAFYDGKAIANIGDK